MSDYSSLKATINANIKANNNHEITGAITNSVLNAMVDSLGAGYQFMGVATPTNPGSAQTPDYKCFYLATTPGTYTNLRGLVVADGEVALLKWDTAWTKEVSGIASADQVDLLYSTIFGNASGTQQMTSPAWGSVSLIKNILIKQGTKFRVKVTSSVPFTRIIVYYNGVNSNRLIDTTENIDGIWQELVAPADITILDTYYVGGSNASVTLDCEFDGIEEIKSEIKRLGDVEQGVISDFKKGSLVVPATSYLEVNVIDGLNIPAGQKLRVRIDVPNGYTRVIINYNGDSNKRLINTTQDIRNRWFEYTATETITQLGIYFAGSANSLVNLYCQSGIYFFPEQSVDESKLANGAVSYEKLGNSVIEKILPTQGTINLYNKNAIIEGKYINNVGGIGEATGWAISPLIPVTAGEKYRISCALSGRNDGLNWYNSNKEFISTEGGIYTLHTAPNNAAYLQFNVASNGNYSTDVMVSQGEDSFPYVPFIQTDAEYIAGLQEVVEGALQGSKLKITKNGNDVSVTDGTNTITAKLENNSGNVYGANPVFNFTGFSYGGLSHGNADDVAPMHILNTTLGANHGQPCQIATIANHGLDNTAIGTGWEQGNRTFYVMRIVDANRILFLSENTGTASAPVFAILSTGALTKDGETLVVSSVAGAQLYPGLKNHSVSIWLNGKQEIQNNGTYSANTIDIVEEYEIMNPDSTLQKIIARAGQSGEPVFDGDSAVRVKNIYRFDGTMVVLVICTAIPLQSVAFLNIMFAQAAIIGSNATKYYIPNSLPLGGGDYDFRIPLAVNWSNVIPYLYISPEYMANPANPVNRVIQYNEASGVGFALGYVKGKGVAKSLLDYTGETFEIRNDTGKIYPHGVAASKVGNTLSPGMIYQAVMYRAPFSFDSLTGRMSMYHFNLDGSEYVFVDYASSILDNVVIDETFNGREIEVVESVNTELLTDVYNGGFMVNSSYVAGETCYIVVKIK